MKHAAIVALAVWLAVIVWVGGLVLRADSSVRLIEPPAPAADTAALQAETVRAREALAALDAVRRSQADAPLAEPALIAVAATPATSALAAAAASADGAAPNAPERNVSLVYYARDFRRAVIDGVYVRPGSRLADGTRVVDIRADGVVLRDAEGRHVLEVARDGRVVGAAPQAGKVSR